MKFGNRTKHVRPRGPSFAQLRSFSAAEMSAVFRRSDAEAARWLEAGARYGLVEAQTLFGQVLLDGRCVAPDPCAAFQWFVIAGEAGYPKAMNMVGRCHELGWGTAMDLAAAARWYRLAAEASSDWGQFNLANLLLRGRGVPLDRRAAFDWYRRAAGQGHAKSMNLVGRFYEEGWEIPADPDVARQWYERAARGGDYRAQYNLASHLLQEGHPAEATAWLRRAVAAASDDLLQIIAATFRDADEPAFRQIGLEAADRLGVRG